MKMPMPELYVFTNSASNWLPSPAKTIMPAASSVTAAICPMLRSSTLPSVRKNPIATPTTSATEANSAASTPRLLSAFSGDIFGISASASVWCRTRSTTRKICSTRAM